MPQRSPCRWSARRMSSGSTDPIDSLVGWSIPARSARVVWSRSTSRCSRCSGACKKLAGRNQPVDMEPGERWALRDARGTPFAAIGCRLCCACGPAGVAHRLLLRGWCVAHGWRVVDICCRRRVDERSRRGEPRIPHGRKHRHRCLVVPRPLVCVLADADAAHSCMF